MSGEHEQESGDNMPLVYAALAENRRLLLAHEREQDAIEAAERVAIFEEGVRDGLEAVHRGDVIRLVDLQDRLDPPDLEYVIAPCWVRDEPC